MFIVPRPARGGISQCLHHKKTLVSLSLTYFSFGKITLILTPISTKQKDTLNHRCKWLVWLFLLSKPALSTPPEQCHRLRHSPHEPCHAEMIYFVYWMKWLQIHYVAMNLSYGFNHKIGCLSQPTHLWFDPYQSFYSGPLLQDQGVTGKYSWYMSCQPCRFPFFDSPPWIWLGYYLIWVELMVLRIKCTSSDFPVLFVSTASLNLSHLPIMWWKMKR